MLTYCKDVVQHDNKRGRLLGDDACFVEREHHRWMVCPCHGERKCNAQRKGGAGEGKPVGCTPAHFVILVSQCLYVLGGGICCTTRGVMSVRANRRVPLCRSGEQSRQCCSAMHKTQAVLTSARAV